MHKFLALLLFAISCGNSVQTDTSSLILFLKNVKKTTSISSNQYSEVVMDSKGNAYISCFYTADAREDHLYVVKLDTAGNIVWEAGTSTRGRATCLAIDARDHIWVGGFYEDRIEIGGCVIEKPGRQFFIVDLDTEGSCKKILEAEGAAIPFDVAINAAGQMMVYGIMGQSLQFGDLLLGNEGSTDGDFLAFFEQDGSCKWIKPINASLLKINANAAGDFFVGGAFHGKLDWEGKHLETTSDWDQDGLFLKINTKGNTGWVQQTGTAGFIKNGYRTQERINDFTFDATGNPVAVAFFQNKGNQEQAALHILTFNEKGTIEKDKIVRNQIAPSNATIGFDDNGYWLTGSDVIQKLGFPDKRQSFFMRLSSTFSSEKTIRAQNGLNTAVRSQYNRNGKTIMAGHYQDLLQIGKDSIQNDGFHTLFVVGF
jgi:hypothetical protein